MVEGLLVIFLLVQFVTHYRMMIRWYREHPLDGQKVARAIQVGIPPDMPDQHADNSAMYVGHLVPEADREWNITPIYHAKNKAVPALEVEDDIELHKDHKLKS